MDPTGGPARTWHLVTLVVVVVALVLQTYLIASGRDLVDSVVRTTAMPERVRQLFSYFTILSNAVAAIVILLTAIPVYLAHRMTRDESVTAGGTAAAGATAVP